MSININHVLPPALVAAAIIIGVAFRAIIFLHPRTRPYWDRLFSKKSAPARHP
jgi:hypothetical protein